MTGEVAGIGALLDGMVVTEGSTSVTFTHVPHGRHWSLHNQPESGGMVRVRKASSTTRPGDTGGGAEHLDPLMDVHLTWEDEAGMDLDAFKDAVEDKVRGILRTNAKSIGTSYWTMVRNVVDQTIVKGGVMLPHLIVTVDARVVETF